MPKITDILGRSQWKAFLLGMSTAVTLFYVGKRLVRTYEDQLVMATFEKAKTLRRAHATTRDANGPGGGAGMSDL